VLFIALISSLSYGQNPQRNNHSKEFIKSCIAEVFGSKAESLVFNNTERYKLISDFFKRTTIELRQDISLEKKIPNLFDQPLNSKYVKMMSKDAGYDGSKALNILKYNIPMTPNKVTMYRVGNTQYVLTTSPIKR
jgi:hypothetical protein